MHKLTAYLVGALILIGLYFSSLYNYLLFHSLAEIFSVVIACGIFMTAWNSRRFLTNDYLLFLGIAYLFIGGLDLAHSLAYTGMPIFQGYDTNLPTQLWIAARYLESLSLLAAPLLLRRRIDVRLVFAGYATVTLVLLLSIFSNIFPACFIEGSGLTLFKKTSEYVICLILLASGALMLRYRDEFDPGVLRLVLWSVALTIGSELSFTFYISPYGFSNLIGHYLKILSFYLIYQAIIETGLTKPYDLLFRELSRQGEWLRVTLDSIGDAVMATDAAGRITFVNHVAQSLTGWRSEDAVGQPIASVLRIIDKKTGEPAEGIVGRALAEGCAVNMANDTALITRNGDEIPIEDSAAPITDSTGNVIGVVLVFRDVTEKRRAQAALRETADRLRIVVDFTYDWEYWRSPDNRFLYVSPSCERITGYTREEFIADPALLTRIIHPDDRERVSEHFRENQLHYGACELEFRILRRDGGTRWIGHACQPVLNDRGKPIGLRASNRDITEHKQADIALRDSESRFRLLSETAGRLLATDNPQGIVEDICREVMAYLDCQTFFNFLVEEQAGRLRLNACAGIPEAEIRKIEWLDYGVAVCGCAARDAQRIVAEEIGKIPDASTELVKSYGIRAYACHPLMVQDKVIGTLSFGTRSRDRFSPEDLALMKTVADQVATAMDRIRLIRELKRSRDDLEIRVQERTTELERRAEQLARLASELTLTEERERRRLAGILHDNLQQLLVAAKMNLEALCDSIGEKRKPAVENIFDLITQSIQASRSLTAELSPPLLQHSGLSTSLKWLGRWMKEIQGLTVDIAVDPRLDPKREDYTLLLYQSVRELLFNIVKHAGVKSARVDMRKDEDGCHRIVVSDHGVGFDSGSVWESANLGTGFGLFSIRERMTLMGGRLEVESQPGMGATFSLILPPEKTQPAAKRIEPRW